ncbi:hypothetical protein [Klebsiella michiganensis]|uniref:hypothetical protein n=1 Tax=Klebsiella michiganensis TaxID=1134687 RepID=UPI00138A2DFE|nr:hypothetical protein [Klebsiella michiganensis]
MAAVGSALSWPLLPEMAATTSLIGAGANAGVGLLINGEVNPNDVILAYDLLPDNSARVNLAGISKNAWN